MSEHLCTTERCPNCPPSSSVWNQGWVAGVKAGWASVGRGPADDATVRNPYEEADR